MSHVTPHSRRTGILFVSLNKRNKKASFYQLLSCQAPTQRHYVHFLMFIHFHYVYRSICLLVYPTRYTNRPIDTPADIQLNSNVHTHFHSLYLTLTHTYIHKRTHTSIHICMYVYIHKHVYTYIYVCIYIHIYIYKHTHCTCVNIFM